MPDFTPSYSTEAYTPDRLIAGHADLITREIVVVSGEGVLARGAVLGKVTASGKYALSDDGASDGSQTPAVILGIDVDATSGDVTAFGYEAGEFNEDALTFGGSHTADTTRDALGARGIYLKKPLSA
jgi:hypothetical protein